MDFEDITLPALRCSLGACPKVERRGDGMLRITGKDQNGVEIPVTIDENYFKDLPIMKSPILPK